MPLTVNYLTGLLCIVMSREMESVDAWMSRAESPAWRAHDDGHPRCVSLVHSLDFLDCKTVETKEDHAQHMHAVLHPIVGTRHHLTKTPRILTAVPTAHSLVERDRV